MWSQGKDFVVGRIELGSDNNASEKEMTEQIWAYYFQGLKIIMDKQQAASTAAVRAALL